MPRLILIHENRVTIYKQNESRESKEFCFITNMDCGEIINFQSNNLYAMKLLWKDQVSIGSDIVSIKILDAIWRHQVSMS